MTEPVVESSAQEAASSEPWLVRFRDRARAPLAVTTLGLGLVGLSSPVPWGEYAMLATLAVALLWALLEVVGWAWGRLADGVESTED